MRARHLAPAVALLSAVACSSVVEGEGTVVSHSAAPSGSTTALSPVSPPPTSTSPSTSPSTTPPTSPPSSESTTLGNDCGPYAQPDPKRPRMSLDATFSADLRTVDGTEQISFTPDRPITELVFRLTANTAPTVAQGNSIRITSATADHGGGTYRFTRAGAAASTQGGLLHIPFAAEIPAGTTVGAKIGFRLALGDESFDRFGRVTHDGQPYAWFGSGQPLLAWERGFGWHDEDLLQFTAESATSEAMEVSLKVTAPAQYTVLASGNPTHPQSAGATQVWTSTSAAARDVSVAVGPFKVSDTNVNGTALRLGAFSAAVRDQLVPEFTRAIRELGKRFGSFPFPSLSVARVPANGGGIEYPGAIMMLDGSRLVAVHETAHQYFYAMVGNSQSQHPWLDEAFASYAQELVDGTPQPTSVLQNPGAVDRSTQSYGSNEGDYYFITYNKGSGALEAARQAAGADKWDRAVRCYVAANAWNIADPADLARALHTLPAGVHVLQRAGALP